MISLSSYMLSRRVINTYMSKLDLIKGHGEYQHFLARLKSVDNSIEIPEETFDYIKQNLTECLSLSPSELMDRLVKNDFNGYLDKIYKTKNTDYFEYFYIAHIYDFYSIIVRNNVDLDEDVQSKIHALITDDVIDKMCNVCKKEELRTEEGTWCVNGIGYVLFYAKLTDSQKKKMQDAFIELLQYYTDNFDITNRNMVYGLTHCIIQLSKFYTDKVGHNTFLDMENALAGVSHKIEGVFTLSNTKSMNSDMLAELLVTYKLIKQFDKTSGTHNYNIGFNELCRRLDNKKGYICDHKEKSQAFELMRNEHTNALFVLCCRI